MIADHHPSRTLWQLARDTCLSPAASPPYIWFMVRNVIQAPRSRAVPLAPALATTVFVVLAAAAAFGWMAYGDGIYLTMIDGILAWCL